MLPPPVPQTTFSSFYLRTPTLFAFPYGLLILFQLAVGGGGGAVLVLSELESMAARQQREIVQQRRLLEQREARLAVLRGTQVGCTQVSLRVPVAVSSRLVLYPLSFLFFFLFLVYALSPHAGTRVTRGKISSVRECTVDLSISLFTHRSRIYYFREKR